MKETDGGVPQCSPWRLWCPAVEQVARGAALSAHQQPHQSFSCASCSISDPCCATSSLSCHLCRMPLVWLHLFNIFHSIKVPMLLSPASFVFVAASNAHWVKSLGAYFHGRLKVYVGHT